MGSKKAADLASEGPSYPKKYWWLILIILPLGLALIQYQPWKRLSASSGGGVSGNQFLGSAIVGNVSLVINEAAKVGATLDPAMIENLKSAANQAKAGDHDAAIAKIEQVRATSGTLANLPSLLNNLGVEYLSVGKVDQARNAFEDVLKTDPENKTAWAGLGQLPDHPLGPVEVVNFSSQYIAGYGPGYLFDGDPSGGWRSADGKMPQLFILELPVESTISELSFNDVASGSANSAAKDIEISMSTQSATAGFQVAAKGTLAQGEIGQGISVRPAKIGRWIKIRILSNHGNPEYTELGDIQISGRPHVQ